MQIRSSNSPAIAIPATYSHDPYTSLLVNYFSPNHGQSSVTQGFVRNERNGLASMNTDFSSGMVRREGVGQRVMPSEEVPVQRAPCSYVLTPDGMTGATPFSTYRETLASRMQGRTDAGTWSSMLDAPLVSWREGVPYNNSSNNDIATRVTCSGFHTDLYTRQQRVIAPDLPANRMENTYQPPTLPREQLPEFDFCPEGSTESEEPWGMDYGGGRTSNPAGTTTSEFAARQQHEKGTMESFFSHREMPASSRHLDPYLQDISLNRQGVLQTPVLSLQQRNTSTATSPVVNTSHLASFMTRGPPLHHHHLHHVTGPTSLLSASSSPQPPPYLQQQRHHHYYYHHRHHHHHHLHQQRYQFQHQQNEGQRHPRENATASRDHRDAVQPQHWFSLGEAYSLEPSWRLAHSSDRRQQSVAPTSGVTGHVVHSRSAPNVSSTMWSRSSPHPEDSALPALPLPLYFLRSTTPTASSPPPSALHTLVRGSHTPPAQLHSPINRHMRDGFAFEAAFAPDVDNMSYEELLDLAERIGRVERGVSHDRLQQLQIVLQPSHFDLDSLRGKAETKMESPSVDSQQQQKKKLQASDDDDDDDSLTCCVCLDSFCVGQLATQLPCCRHFLHDGCAARWFENHFRCPICTCDVRGTEK